MKALTVLFAILLMVTSGKVLGQEVETFTVANNVIRAESLEERQMQIDCLASNIYYEARGEPRRGQKAVALVTINRVKDNRWEDDICSVVRTPYQFSWYRPGLIQRMRHSDDRVYQEIRAMATYVYDVYYLAGRPDDLVEGATHFHTPEVNPQWRGKRQVARIGNHIFFKVGR